MKLEIPKRKARNGLSLQSAAAYRASLPLQLGEMQKAIEIAADLLKRNMDSYEFGEEFNQAQAWMERVQGIYDEATNCVETGKMWREEDVGDLREKPSTTEESNKHES